MKSFLSVLVLTSFAIAAPAAAADEAAVAPPKEKKICRVAEELGTILPKRVCRTRKVWAAIDAEQAKITQNDTDRIRENPGTSLHDPAPR